MICFYFIFSKDSFIKHMSNNRLANVNTRALGLNGTRFAVVTFATSATVHLQIDDRHTRTVNAMKAKIDEIQVNKMLFIY